MIKTLGSQMLEVTEKAGGEWAIYIEDLSTNESFMHQEKQPFYAASLIKVPIMSTVFQAVHEGCFSFEDTITLRAEDLVGGAGVLQHLTPGTPITICDLVMLMIIQSDNSATNILIDLVGEENIRSMLHNTNMSNSLFYNKLMVIPAKLEGTNTITAEDMAKHFRLLATGKIISYDASLKMLSILKKQQVRDAIPYTFPDPDPTIIGGLPLWELANKTGSVTDLQHDVGILYVGQHAILLAFLSRGLDNNSARQTIAKLGKMVFDQYNV
ncbi:serine hydrolase [Brevibacillus laterosporus]|nr:serine hydrolase [Brevibacillus laterosporus]TPG86894.1 serine hydrolase [Brevibacillus laterosporus]